MIAIRILTVLLIAIPLLYAAEALDCPELGKFDPDDWRQIEAAFAQAPVLEFIQPWRNAKEAGFRPGSVRIGWRGDRLLYHADLTDDSLVSRASGRNQPLWQLGDVLELFAGVSGNTGYIEYHHDPQNHRLQLRFADAAAFSGVKNLDGLLRLALKDDTAVSRTRRTARGWQVYGEIPAASLPGGMGPLKGKTWQINFGRYDYRDAKSEPVLSATSPLTKPSYHRRNEWRLIRFSKP